MKGTFDLCCTARARKRGEEQSKRVRKLTSYLDFTNVCLRNNIIIFTVRFFFQVLFEGALQNDQVTVLREGHLKEPTFIESMSVTHAEPGSMTG